MSGKFGAQFPMKLTAEENLLTMKYQQLRLARQNLEQQKNQHLPDIKTGIKKCLGSSSQEAKMAAKEVWMMSQVGTNKDSTEKILTKHFKRASRQSNGDIQKRRAMKEYGGEDHRMSSVVIKGQRIDKEFIHKHFRPIDKIWKIKFHDGAVILTFETESGAKSAVAKMDGVTVDGTLLSVSLVKRKNNSWTACAMESSTIDKRNIDSGCPSHIVYAKLKGEVTRQELNDLFRPVGGLQKVFTPKCMNYGFVAFKTEEAANRAILELNGKDFRGVPLVVDRAKSTGTTDTNVSIRSGNKQSEPDPRDLIHYD